MSILLTHRSERLQDNFLFDSLEEMLHKSKSNKIYTDSTNEKAAQIISVLQLDSIRQAIVAFFFDKKAIQGKYSFIVKKGS